jgi:hypothetical protein
MLTFGILILADTLLAILRALKNKTFSWNLVGDWVQKLGLQGAGLFILAILSALKTEVFVAFYPAVLTLTASLVKQIIDKINDWDQNPVEPTGDGDA